MKPETEADVRELLEAYLPAAALAAALELGLFWYLAEGPRPLDRLAEEMGVPVERCRPWLDELCMLGLLDRREHTYGLSESGRSAIVDRWSRETWRFLAEGAREGYRAGEDLALRLREPVAPRAGADELPSDLTDYVEEMRRDPDRARRFTHLLFELHGDLAQNVAAALDLTGVGRLMDLGGGSGVMSLALLRRNPELTAVVVDLPAVCEAGREIADGTEEGSRLSHHAVDDFIRDELPGGFDVVFQCDVAIFTPALFGKISRALVDGGRFIAVERWFDAGQPMDARLIAYLFARSLRDPSLKLPRLTEIQTGMRDAGLAPMPVVELPGSGWSVLEARKVGDLPG